MKRRTNLPELLSPAGSYEALLAAVRGGADAVYLGGKSYGARAFADNFDTEELSRAVRYAHLHGVRVYVTVNTLLFDREMDECMAYVKTLYRLGADAIICADLGLIRRIRHELPDMEIHASTQVSIHNVEGANALAKMGIARVVVARELSEGDICEIVEKADAEVEAFVHGALCVCHSGQCLFSSIVGGRSGNRGECAQPCRLPYNGKENYPLSLCDLSLARHIRALVLSGVASLKIEGRMKSAEYVFGVTSIYRRLLDECRDATREEEKRLESLFSRGGKFTDAYFTGRLEQPMTGVRTEADKAASRAAEPYKAEPMRHAVRAKAKFVLGEPSELTLYDEKKSVTAYGEIPSVAQNAPLNIDDLQTRLCKMGATFLLLNKNDIEIELDGGVNLSPSAINALRRAAAEKFEDAARPEPPQIAELAIEPLMYDRQAQPFKSAVFYKKETLRALDAGALRTLDAVLLPLFSHEDGIGANGVLMPPVIFPHEWEEAVSRLRELKGKIRYVMVDNISQIELVLSLGFEVLGGMRLNITNAYTRDYYRSRGVQHQMLSPELTPSRIRDIGGGVLIYGRIPLMITERCFVREVGGCQRCGSFELCDRRGARFPVLREFKHRSLIFNSIPTYMGDKREQLRSVGMEHMIFSVESADEVRRILRANMRGEELPFAVRRIK